MTTNPEVMFQTTWLHRPLFINAGGSPIIAGVDTHLSWYLCPDAPFAADSPKGGMVLLPFMQPGYGGDLSHARSTISTLLFECGLPPAWASTFPFHAPVLWAFEHSPAWTPFAIDWLDGIDIPPHAEPLLRAAVADKAFPQQIRHRVRTFLARRERAAR